MRSTSTGRAGLAALPLTVALTLSGATAGMASETSPSGSTADTAVLLPAPSTFGLQPLILASSTAVGQGRAVLVAAPATEPAAKLPACRYRDKLTRHHKTKHWRKTLLDTNLRLKRGYEPWDLVSVRRASVQGSGRVRKVIISDLRAMAEAARKAGKPFAVRSAYRSYATQVATFDSWVQRSGYQQALKFSARPGHSEHQLGTTVDFTTAPGVPLRSSFGKSAPGKWLKKHSWKYGFIMSYPKGKRRVSCYGYEPWHFRHVGRKNARAIHESGQVPRRYFWQNHESPS